jgi:hypothetical protein
MIGESVAKFWAVGSRSEYASRLGVWKPCLYGLSFRHLDWDVVPSSPNEVRGRRRPKRPSMMKDTLLLTFPFRIRVAAVVCCFRRDLGPLLIASQSSVSFVPSFRALSRANWCRFCGREKEGSWSH